MREEAGRTGPTGAGWRRGALSRLRGWLPELALALIFLLLYGLTLTDGGDPGKVSDSLTLQRAARNITPPYFTGFPLYMLVAILGTRLPLPGAGAPMAFYASALPMIATLLLFYRCSTWAGGSRTIAFVCALLVGMNHDFWLAATNIYNLGIGTTLQWALYLAVILYCHERSPRRWLLVVAAFAFGCAVHPLNLVLGLPLLVLLGPGLVRRDPPPRTWAYGLLILLAAASLYLYLPITSPRAPESGNLRSVAGLLHYLSGAGRAGHLFDQAGAWPASLRMLWLHFCGWNLGIWLVLAPMGAVVLLVRAWRVGFFMILSQSCVLVFVLFYYSTGHPQYYVIFLVGTVFLWVAALLGAAAARLESRDTRLAWVVPAVVGLLFLLQVSRYGVLDYHVRRVRAESPLASAAETAVRALPDGPLPVPVYCDADLLPWLEVKALSTGFHARLSLVPLEPAGPLPAPSARSLYLSRREPGPAASSHGATREVDLGANLPRFGRDDLGSWRTCWIEYGKGGPNPPLCLRGVQLKRTAPGRIRVRCMFADDGFHKPPADVVFVLRDGEGRELARDTTRLNHLGRVAPMFLHCDEFVDQREFILPEPLAEGGVLWVEPSFPGRGLDRMDPPRLLVLE